MAAREIRWLSLVLPSQIIASRLPFCYIARYVPYVLSAGAATR
jgi:hypothetical protein